MSQKRVCLLFPRFYEGFIMRKVPLGLAYIAATLQQRGIYVEAYNLNVDTLEEIDLSSFDFIGISCLTPFINEVNRMLAYIKPRYPKAKIVLGGPHPTYKTKEVFDEIPQIDYVVTGEGENALPELVLHEDRHGEIPGVYYKTKFGLIEGLKHKPVDLDELPYPNQRLFDHGRLEKRNPYRAILGSRGCPFKCANCQPILTDVQPFRMRDTDSLLEEMRFLNQNYGQNYFGFLDSEFPIKRSWFADFSEKVKSSDLEFSFHCNAYSNILNDDILRMYKDLNINRLAIGVESGVQRVIDEVIFKHIDLNHTYNMFKSAWDIGIRTHGHFMFGIPGETLDDMQQTLNYATELPAKSIEFNMVTPWPGTRFYHVCVENNYLSDTDCSKYNEKRESFISTEDFSAQDVNDFYQTVRHTLISKGYKNSPDGSVYYHPSYDGPIE